MSPPVKMKVLLVITPILYNTGKAKRKLNPRIINTFRDRDLHLIFTVHLHTLTINRY